MVAACAIGAASSAAADYMAGRKFSWKRAGAGCGLGLLGLGAAKAAGAGARAIAGMGRSGARPGGPGFGSSGGPGAGKRFPEAVKDKARRDSNDTCVFCKDKTTRSRGEKQSNIDHADPDPAAETTHRRMLRIPAERATKKKLHERIKSTQPAPATIMDEQLHEAPATTRQNTLRARS